MFNLHASRKHFALLSVAFILSFFFLFHYFVVLLLCMYILGLGFFPIKSLNLFDCGHY